MSPANIFSSVIYNYGKTAKMLHIKGDEIFRVNIPFKPHLDQISGVLFFVGIIYFLLKKRKYVPFIFLCFIVLPIPSIFPSILSNEIPSSARTIALIPIIYVCVGAGLTWIFSILRSLVKTRIWAASVFVVLIVGITYHNLAMYMKSYARGLPDQNLAPGLLIANYIEKFPKSYGLYFASCCWGQRGQPEPKGVGYNLKKPFAFMKLYDTIHTCGEITHLPALVITSINDSDSESMLKKCNFAIRKEMISSSLKGNIALVLVLTEQPLIDLKQ